MLDPGRRMIYAGRPSFCGLGLAGRSYSSWLASTVNHPPSLHPSPGRSALSSAEATRALAYHREDVRLCLGDDTRNTCGVRARQKKDNNIGSDKVRYSNPVIRLIFQGISCSTVLQHLKEGHGQFIIGVLHHGGKVGPQLISGSGSQP